MCQRLQKRSKLEGNVLRNLRLIMFQMLNRKNFQMFPFIMFKCPWCPNVSDVQMSVKSKYPWCLYVRPWCPNVHDVVTLVTCDDNNDMWSHLSLVATSTQKGSFMAMLISPSRGTYLIGAWQGLLTTSLSFGLKMLSIFCTSRVNVLMIPASDS